MTYYLLYRMPGGTPVIETYNDKDSALRAGMDLIGDYPSSTVIVEDQTAEVFLCRFGGPMIVR